MTDSVQASRRGLWWYVGWAFESYKWYGKNIPLRFVGDKSQYVWSKLRTHLKYDDRQVEATHSSTWWCGSICTWYQGFCICTELHLSFGSKLLHHAVMRKLPPLKVIPGSSIEQDVVSFMFESIPLGCTWMQCWLELEESDRYVKTPRPWFSLSFYLLLIIFSHSSWLVISGWYNLVV